MKNTNTILLLLILVAIVIFIVIWIMSSGKHGSMTPIEHAAKMIVEKITISESKVILFYPLNQLQV